MTGWVPTARLLVVSVAWPFDTLPVPMELPLSKKVTVPVSPEPVPGKTVAVNVTDCPKVDGLTLLNRPSVVGDWLTVTEADVVVALAPKPEPPP